MSGISVIIPAHNRPEQLARALGSVVAQSFRDFEVLVVDDGSRPALDGVVRACHDSRVKYLRHREPLGASAARNTGIRHARSDFIALLDDDDSWEPDKLSLQWQRFQKASARLGIIHGGCSQKCDRSDALLSVSQPRVRGEAYVDSLSFCILASPTPLIPRQCFDATGLYDESFPASQDREMWIRITRRYTVDFVNAIVANRFIHSGQMTSDLRVKVAGRTMLYHKFRNVLDANPACKAKHLDALDRLYTLDHRMKNARDFLRDMIFTRKSGKYTPHFRLALSVLSPHLYRNIMQRRFPQFGGVRHYY